MTPWFVNQTGLKNIFAGSLINVSYFEGVARPRTVLDESIVRESVGSACADGEVF